MSVEVVSHPAASAQPCAHTRALGSAEALPTLAWIAARDPFPLVLLHVGTGTCARLGPELAQSRLSRKVS